MMIRGNIEHRSSNAASWRSPILSCALIVFASSTVTASNFEYREGGIIRGPKTEKKIAFEFTGDSFAEGGTTILDEMAKHKGKASFFFTGKFMRNPEFKPLIERIIKEGHYIAPHSDAHLLYCPWSGEKKTLVTRDVFREDLEKNIKAIE